MYAAGYGIAPMRSPRSAIRSSRAKRVLLVLALAAVFTFAMARAVLGFTQPVYSTVTVEPGDTLWTIAAERYPNDDVRARVGEIMQLNGLSSPVIEVGEALTVPDR